LDESSDECEPNCTQNYFSWLDVFQPTVEILRTYHGENLLYNGVERKLKLGNVNLVKHEVVGELREGWASDSVYCYVDQDAEDFRSGQ
jgi:hypothetical protein